MRPPRNEAGLIEGAFREFPGRGRDRIGNPTHRTRGADTIAPPAALRLGQICRYSSELQDASSIEQQQRKCREEANRNQHDLRPELEFADHAVSGTRIDRDGFQAMLAAARDSKFRVLYFENLSRLARGDIHPKMARTTSPPLTVTSSLRLLCMMYSSCWSMPNACRIVAWRSFGDTGLSTAA